MLSLFGETASHSMNKWGKNNNRNRRRQDKHEDEACYRVPHGMEGLPKPCRYITSSHHPTISCLLYYRSPSLSVVIAVLKKKVLNANSVINERRNLENTSSITSFCETPVFKTSSKNIQGIEEGAT